MLGKDIVRDFPLGGSQLIIGGMDSFQDIHLILFVHDLSPFEGSVIAGRLEGKPPYRKCFYYSPRIWVII